MIKIKKTIIKIYGRIGWYYHKIEDPRVIRIVQFLLYLTMGILGAMFLYDLPESFEGILGIATSTIFGIAITGGGFIGSFAVLPALWWLERLAIICLWIGLVIYISVVIALNGSPIGIAVAVCLILSFVNRWLQEYNYQISRRVKYVS